MFSLTPSCPWFNTDSPTQKTKTFALSKYYTLNVNCPIRELDLYHVTSRFIIEQPPRSLRGIRARILR